ncbi:MAG: hypothetical protein ACOC9B_04605 [Chloroflexota bacterium]
MSRRSILSPSEIIGVGLGLAIFASFFFVPVVIEADPPNPPPDIQAVQINESVIYPRDVITLVCEATDSDSDDLTYNWSATGGAMQATHARAQWTAPTQPGTHMITVEVADSAGDSTSMPVSVEVRQNQPPVIEELWCQDDTLLPRETTSLLCTASDADEQALSYEWSSALGDLESNGATATWTAPMAPGSYIVSVRVRDGHGGETTRTTLMHVYLPEAPVIDELIVRPLVPEYSTPTREGYRLIRGSFCECDIECIARAGGQELEFDWSTSAGEIYGDGSHAAFIPPMERTDVVVTVTVSDAFAQSASAEALFSVYYREPFADNDDPGASCGSCRGR